MTAIRDLSSGTSVTSDDGTSITTGTITFQPHHQYGLFATAAYSEGDAILTESPLVVSSSSGSDVRSQFNASSLATATAAPKKSAATGKKSTKNKDDNKTSPPPISYSDLILPQSVLKKIIPPASSSSTDADSSRTRSKLRGMILALASYAANPPSEENANKLFELHHPSINKQANGKEEAKEEEDGTEKDALKLARLALKCCAKMCAPESALSALLQKTNGSSEKSENEDRAMKLLLIYSCNAFEGGRIYHRISRVNHSCNPNAVIAEGNDKDVSVLKAACDIVPGDEINISYLGKYLFAGYPIRQKVLRAEKHFVCRCVRCSSSSSGDLASRIPCPICHPRTNGRYLDEDVMFDEDDEFKVSYAIPDNGMTAEERTLRSPTCKGITAIVPDGKGGGGGGSMRKKKEGTAIKYMCMAEDKVLDRLESNCGGGGNDDNDGQSSGSGGRSGDGGDDTETERDIDQQFLQMATSICGARHWTTHFLNLSLIEESLASFHSTLMTMGRDSNRDAEVMEDLFVEIAEAADGIERAYSFAHSLKLKIDPAHWLFDYTVGLARTLVGLGDVKSQKYGAEWIKKVERYSEKFENDGMNKVVRALRDAWKRGEEEEEDKGDETTKKKMSSGKSGGEGQEEQKRRRIE